MSRISAALASALILLASANAGLAQTPEAEAQQGQGASCSVYGIFTCEDEARDEFWLCTQTRPIKDCMSIYAATRNMCAGACQFMRPHAQP